MIRYRNFASSLNFLVLFIIYWLWILFLAILLSHFFSAKFYLMKWFFEHELQTIDYGNNWVHTLCAWNFCINCEFHGLYVINGLVAIWLIAIQENENKWKIFTLNRFWKINANHLCMFCLVVIVGVFFICYIELMAEDLVAKKNNNEIYTMSSKHKVDVAFLCVSILSNFSRLFYIISIESKISVR